MRNSFKCPYIILTYKIEDDIPLISFESFNSADTAKQSIFTVKNSHLCQIKTNNDCRIILSYADFIQSIKIAKATGEYVEITAGNPGTAFIMEASNGARSLKLISSLATLADDDFIASSLSSQASSISTNHANKNKQNVEEEEEQVNTSLSPPESPIRARHSVHDETRLNETGRLSSSNNSQYTTSTQVVPWKTNSDDFSASPEFPSKRKHSEIVINKSQPTDDDYNDEENEEDAPTGSNNRIY